LVIQAWMPVDCDQLMFQPGHFDGGRERSLSPGTLEKVLHLVTIGS
jgi:hypothetical protein